MFMYVYVCVCGWVGVWVCGCLFIYVYTYVCYCGSRAEDGSRVKVNVQGGTCALQLIIQTQDIRYKLIELNRDLKEN
jgi:hypothetical protein